MDKLIPVINKLQNVFNTAGTALVQLPQIVVVGEQVVNKKDAQKISSSGKSSVLESIVGRSCLPRGINIVTRCPIVLQMVQMDESDVFYQRKSDELGAEEWCEFPHLPEDESCVTDFENITDIINTEVTKRAGGSKGIVKDEIILRIMSPYVINLTVVDLPGIVRNATEGQPQDIEDQINALLKTYISNPNSIILAVSAANNDIAVSESIKLAKTVDPYCNRTIAVLTKLDLMDKGTDASDALTGKTLSVKLGIIGVVNRSYDDIKNNVSIDTSIRKEAIFLLDKYPTIASQNGIPFLKTRLRKLLMEHIKKCLPPLQTRLANMQVQARNELQELGNEPPKNKSATMLHIIEEFCNGYKASIVGKNRHIQKMVLTGGGQINLAFEEKLAESLKNIVPEQDLQNKEILMTISNSRGIESSVLIPEPAYQDLVRDQIYRLEAPALQCAGSVNTEMINIMQIWMTLNEREMQRFPNLNAAILMEVTELLSQRHLVAQELLKNYVEVQASFIKTIQMDFNTEMLDLIKKNPLAKDELHSSIPIVTTGHGQGVLMSVIGDDLTEIQTTQCLVVRKLVQNYFQIVKTAFQDYCPKAIAHAVIYFMERNIQRHLIEKLHVTDKIEQLVQENAIVADQRIHTNDKLHALDSAIEVIREIRETNF